MELSNWLMFTSIIGLAAVSPGPNVLTVVVQTLEAGIRGAFFTILGNLIALFTIALAAAIGVGTLLQAAPSVFTTMKVAGGAYLAWMGIKMLRSSFGHMPSIHITPKAEHQPGSSRLKFVVRAMLISYSNPKSILFLSAVFPAFLDESASVPLQFGIMFTTIICIVSVIHGAYAAMALRMNGRLVGTVARKMMARFAGVSFLGFGAGFIYDAQK